MKKFQGKLSEMRGLERDLAEREEELRLTREENERMRRDLAQAWVRGKDSDPAKLRGRLKATQERLEALAQTARLFLQQTAQIPMPERDSIWTQLMENLAFEIEKSLSASICSPRVLSRGPSPGRSPFESTTYESKFSELSRNSPDLEHTYTETTHFTPHQRDMQKLKRLVRELQRRNEALEATIEQLEGRLREEEQVKVEKEALERDCEELKQENVQFIGQLEWMAGEQTSLQQTLATYEETAQTALSDLYQESLSSHQASLSPLLVLLNSAIAKVTALTAKVTLLRPRTNRETADKQLRKALQMEIQRAEGLEREVQAVRTDVESSRSRIAGLEKTEAAGKSEIRALKTKLTANEAEKKTIIGEKDTEIANLQAKLKENSKTKEEVRSLRNEIASLRKQFDSERKGLESQLKSQSIEESRLENSLKSSENAKIRLESDLKSLQKEIKRLEGLLKASETEGLAAREELMLIQQTNEAHFKAQIAENSEERALLEAELSLKAAELKNLHAKFELEELARGKMVRTMRNVKGAVRDIARLRREVASFLQSLREMLQTLSTDLAKVVFAQAESQENAIIHLQRELKQLQEENSALGSENSFLNQETEHLKTDLERERLSKAHHSTAISEANSAMKALHASWQVSSQEYKEVYDLAVALQIQLTETELRKEECREQGLMLAEDWARWGERVVPMSVHRTQVKRLEKENERKEKELDQVTESLFKLVRQQEEQQELLAQKERALNRAEEERFRLEQLLSSSRKMALEEMESLNQELMQLKEQLSKKDFQLEKLASIRRSLETRNSDLQVKLAEVQNTSVDKSDKLAKGRLSKGHCRTCAD